MGIRSPFAMLREGGNPSRATLRTCVRGRGLQSPSKRRSPQPMPCKYFPHARVRASSVRRSKLRRGKLRRGKLQTSQRAPCAASGPRPALRAPPIALYCHRHIQNFRGPAPPPRLQLESATRISARPRASLLLGTPSLLAKKIAVSFPQSAQSRSLMAAAGTSAKARRHV